MDERAGSSDGTGKAGPPGAIEHGERVGRSTWTTIDLHEIRCQVGEPQRTVAMILGDRRADTDGQRRTPGRVRAAGCKELHDAIDGKALQPSPQLEITVVTCQQTIGAPNPFDHRETKAYCARVEIEPLVVRAVDQGGIDGYDRER